MNWGKLKFWNNSQSHFDYSREKYSEWEIINSLII